MDKRGLTDYMKSLRRMKVCYPGQEAMSIQGGG